MPLIENDAAVNVGWRYGDPYAFYDTAADPDFAAEYVAASGATS